MDDDILLDDEGNILEKQADIEEHEEENEELDENEVSSSGEDSESSEDSQKESEHGTEEDDEREAIRARRREERRHKKEAQRDREESLRRELASRDAIINELRARQDAFERRNVGNDLAQLENTKRQIAQAYNYYKDQIRVATESGNGAVVADATEKMLQAQRKFDEVTQYEEAMKRQQAAPQPLDPRLTSNAQKWMNANKWYNATGSDQDSRVVLTLDNQLAAEGWDPTTEAYWDELSARVKKYLPHRAAGAKITAQSKPKVVVAGSGRESVGSKKGTYRLSPERVAALKEAGIWDDPAQRADAVKRFREYDKQNQG